MAREVALLLRAKEESSRQGCHGPQRSHGAENLREASSRWMQAGQRTGHPGGGLGVPRAP